MILAYFIPMPSPYRSNPCGSGAKTLKSVSGTSGQFKSDGGDVIHKPGYEESHLLICPYVCGLE